MLPGIFVQVPSGLAAQGSIISGISNANRIITNTTEDVSKIDNTVLALGFSMMQVSDRYILYSEQNGGDNLIRPHMLGCSWNHSWIVYFITIYLSSGKTCECSHLLLDREFVHVSRCANSVNLGQAKIH